MARSSTERELATSLMTLQAQYNALLRQRDGWEEVAIHWENEFSQEQADAIANLQKKNEEIGQWKSKVEALESIVSSLSKSLLSSRKKNAAGT